MILHIIGQNGYYQGSMDYMDDPNEIYGIPYGTTKKEPPILEEGQYAVWGGSFWYATTVPPPPFQPPAPVKNVPESITKYQAKMALLEFGLFEQVEEYIKNTEDIALKISWYDAANFYRNNQFITSLAEHFNLTQDQIDDLFILANNY